MSYKTFYHDKSVRYEHYEDGQGVFYFPDRTCIRGVFHQERLNGPGKGYYATGELMYEGKIENNYFSGQGKKYYKSEKLMYEGGFSIDEYHGQGKEYYENGKIKYDGCFEKGQYNGYGTSYHEDGSIYKSGYWYKGNFVDKNEKLKKYYDSGKLWYEGTIPDEKNYCHGKRYDTHGNIIYEGGFLGDSYHGYGKCYKHKKLYYEGHFENSALISLTRLYLNNGYIEGDLKFFWDYPYIMVVGYGIHYTFDKKVIYKGLFSKNQYHGNGILTKNGNYLEGEFNNGIGKNTRGYKKKDGKIVEYGLFTNENLTSGWYYMKYENNHIWTMINDNKIERTVVNHVYIPIFDILAEE